MSAHHFVIGIILVLNCTFSSNAQKSKSKPSDPKPKSITGPTSSVSAIDKRMPKDYVPCLMDKKELYDLRGRPLDAPISLQAAQQILSESSKKATGSLKSEYEKQGKDRISELTTKGLLTYKSLADSLNIAAAKSASDNAETTDTNLKEQQKAIEDSINSQTDLTQDSQFQRPTDVSCAMSVYSWNVARMIFGRTVANNYLAVQVTVRNLDANHEYLLHDAELAVDATSGQLERFQTSSEKQAVRGVTIYGQSYDRRALWGHGVEGLGFILGAVIGVIDVQNLTSASGAYAAGFQPAFNKLFPDLSTNNLNNLNDLGFSAASASRIVVPKGGSVPFVIFVPLKPLEQACWLQPGYNPRADYYPYTACDSINDRAPVSYFHFHGLWPTKVAEDHEKKFKDWTPDEVTALQKHAFAVVAGMHIQGVDSQAASARSVTCTAGTATPRVADLKGLPLSCVITGAALSTLKSLHLTPADGSDTSKTIDLPLVANSDSTTVTFTLTPDQLNSLTASTYTLEGRDATSKSSALDLAFNIVPLPTLKSLSPAILKATDLKNKSASVSFIGTNLSQVTQLKLALDSSPDTSLLVQITFVTSNKIVAMLPKMSPTTGIYHVFLVLDPAAQVVVDTKETLTIN